MLYVNYIDRKGSFVKTQYEILGICMHNFLYNLNGLHVLLFIAEYFRYSG